MKPQHAPSIAPATFALAVVTAIEHGEDSLGRGDAAAASEQALFALRRLFADDESLSRAAWLRFNALVSLHAEGALGYWQRESSSGRSQFHPAVLDAASQQRLSANGRFAKRKFLAVVEDIAQAHYADFEQWPLPR